jgi:2-oxoglutarate ferredoxin oxidoreductase subunit beta
MLRRAAAHPGAAFVEILQNCNIYNDGAFDIVREEDANRIYLKHGEPIRFGAEGEKGVVQLADGSAKVVEVSEVGEEALLFHDEHHPEPSLAFALSRLTLGTVGAAPLGVFRDVEAPVYDDLLTQQLEESKEKEGEGSLEALLHAGDTWTIA